MKKLLLFKYKNYSERGFTTLEVLVSIIIALAFVSVAMQSFVLAMGMKVQAQEKQRANQLIQEDLERIANLASNIAEDHNVKCSPVATVAVGAVPAKTAYQNGYAQELWNDLAAIAVPTAQLLRKADGTESGNTLTLARTHVSGTSSNTPHRTLKVNYQVTDSDGDVVAERYVEVIPDVALLCP
jgi:type II secretory pathway pseudopilin PulG